MKLKELKHNHSLTDLLKIIIFALLMLAPIASIATRCLYVICNKNAYQSAEITQTTYNRTPKYTQGDINNGLENEKIYHFNINNDNPSYIFLNSDGYIKFTVLNGGFSSLPYTSIYIDDNGLEENDNYSNITIYSTEINFYSSNSNFYISVYLDETTPISFNGDILVIGFSGIDEEYAYFSNTTYQDYNYTEVEATTLDNVFEYSVNKLENIQLFNWTENTAIFTGLKAMTTQLEITGNVIPILITYWFLLTIIYVIIDIILKLFTILTHMIGNKQA